MVDLVTVRMRDYSRTHPHDVAPVLGVGFNSLIVISGYLGEHPCLGFVDRKHNRAPGEDASQEKNLKPHVIFKFKDKAAIERMKADLDTLIEEMEKEE